MDASSSVLQHLNVVMNVQRNAVIAKNKCSMGNAEKHVEEQMFATISAKTFAATNSALLAHISAPLTVHIHSVLRNVEKYAVSVLNHANLNVSTQSVLKSVMSHVIENLAKNHVPKSLDVNMIVLGSVENHVQMCAELKTAKIMTKKLLKYFSVRKMKKIRDLFYFKTAVIALKNKHFLITFNPRTKML